LTKDSEGENAAKYERECYYQGSHNYNDLKGKSNPPKSHFDVRHNTAHGSHDYLYESKEVDRWKDLAIKVEIFDRLSDKPRFVIFEVSRDQMVD
jgi:hypothetical protein